MKKALLSIILLLFIQIANAQCAMCKAVVESGGNRDEAEGLNSGILYLMIFPYLLVGALFFIIIRYKIAGNKKNKI
ncbi:MAG TPA: hypothetical protein VLM44_09650 [Lutibacter sp.]|nr:hypothetical protein [Lutibacter sp.]